MILFGCLCLGFAPPACDAAPLKVGMVSDAASFNDAGFNQSCQAGLQRAMREFKVEGCFRESRGHGDYLANLNDLAGSGCGLVIGIGALMQRDMAAAATNHPDVKFALVDGEFYPPLPNVQSLLFSVDEAAFQAGYLAAAWTDVQSPPGGKVGYVGGVKIASVEQFILPFQAGVSHFNRKHGKAIQVLGDYAGTFENPRQGRELGERLIAAGATVIFAAAGQTGAGALAAAKAKGKWGIGVDADQYYTLPEVRDCLLTSCLKRMDRAVYALVQDVLTGRFRGGGVMTGSLANGQVGLAPFHSLEKQIPAPIIQELADLQQDIQGNRVTTGWPAK